MAFLLAFLEDYSREMESFLSGPVKALSVRQAPRRVVIAFTILNGPAQIRLTLAFRYAKFEVIKGS